MKSCVRNSTHNYLLVSTYKTQRTTDGVRYILKLKGIFVCSKCLDKIELELRECYSHKDPYEDM